MPDALLLDVTKGVGAAAGFMLAFAPGFVAMKTYDYFQQMEPRKVQDLVYEIVGYSAVSYAVVSPLLVFAALQWRAAVVNAWYLSATLVMMLLLAPFALGRWAAALQRRAEQKSSIFITSIKTPWDYAFRNRRTCIVEAELKDGSKVAGIPGTASNYPYEHELFIAQQWTVENDKAVAAIAESRGILLFRDDIQKIRFLAKPESIGATLNHESP